MKGKIFKNGIKIVYHQKRIPKKGDSFWYDGDIATLTYKGREVTLVATGEIRIHNKDRELVYDNKQRGPGFPEFKNHEPQSDKDLTKLEQLGYYWQNNNWFEVFYVYNTVNGVKYEDAVLGDVAFTYKEGLMLAKEYLKIALLIDEEFWAKIEKEKIESRENQAKGAK